MANFAYTRMINGFAQTIYSDTFFDIAVKALRELEDKKADYFGTIEKSIDGYGKWDMQSVVQSVVDEIQKAIWYRQMFLVEDPWKKNAVFREYVKFDRTHLNLDRAAYPWCKESFLTEAYIQ